MNPFDQLGMDFADLIGPWIAILVSISAAFWFKDFAQNMMIGLKFKFNPAFNEGDSVLLDGNDAIIVKIGLRETVFGVYGEKGYTWRYVPNTRIPFLKLEKIVNKDLHLDTDAEKGRRLQEMIDKAQDERIDNNGHLIAENKATLEKFYVSSGLTCDLSRGSPEAKNAILTNMRAITIMSVCFQRVIDMATLRRGFVLEQQKHDFVSGNTSRRLLRRAIFDR